MAKAILVGQDSPSMNETMTTHVNDTTKHMTAADRVKIDGIATGATKTTVTNNLTTTVTGTALDAAQGKLLNDRVTKQERMLTATLTAAGWSASAPYTQSVNLSGIAATDYPVIGIVLSGTADQKKAQLTAWNMVNEIKTGAGNIIATCITSKPTTNITIQIKGA